MGVLISGNIGSDKVAELETISCPHCQATAAIVLKGCSKNVPYHHWCGRCNQAICKACAEVMERLGHCPGPFIAQVEASMNAGRNLESFEYNYRSTQRA